LEVDMRDDQIARMAEITEKIADVVLDEADPANWTAIDKKPNQMTVEERGGRYWDKKNANASMALLLNMQKLQINTKAALGRDPYKDEELDGEIASAEKQAKKLLDEMQLNRKKKSTWPKEKSVS
jgi:hypothetical protein